MHPAAHLADPALQYASLPFTLDQLLADPLLDRALGCLFASMIGDALGSYV